MGFPSPAVDYVEDRLTIEKLCDIDMNSRVIEANGDWAVINISLKPEKDRDVRWTQSLCQAYGGALITEGGEAIEGDALDDIFVHGVVTHTITRMREDYGVV